MDKVFENMNVLRKGVSNQRDFEKKVWKSLKKSERVWRNESKSRWCLREWDQKGDKGWDKCVGAKVEMCVGALWNVSGVSRMMSTEFKHMYVYMYLHVASMYGGDVCMIYIVYICIEEHNNA